MLFKNGEKYNLTNQDKKELREAFKKFPVVMKYDSSLISVENGEPRSPSAIGIELTTNAIDKVSGTTDTWTFAENTRKSKNGDTIYYPSHLLVSKSYPFKDPDDIELLFYVYRFYPSVRGGASYNPSRKTNFEFVDNEKKAIENIESEKPMVYVKYKILDEDTKDEYLERVAKAMFIPDVDELSRPEIQDAILKQFKGLKTSELKEKVAYFKEVIESEEKSSIRIKIQEAIDDAKIGFDPKAKRWFYFNPTGTRGSEILRVMNGDPNEKLVARLLDVANVREEFFAYIGEDDKKKGTKKAANNKD